eukprot:CAMPEP_0170595150 /NCGR_PEP_ID=MMETSP0224-20130122/14398_1 /TAXON_ID=285029 /ORGANISM="Togula jolla, Strain CCCM 725" /LENGTH=71 /DNA_ID=CAMNT_0010919291 /DNA_START=341 /DNA_END=556 /DNA_ORIENTATION=-
MWRKKCSSWPASETLEGQALLWGIRPEHDEWHATHRAPRSPPRVASEWHLDERWHDWPEPALCGADPPAAK